MNKINTKNKKLHSNYLTRHDALIVKEKAAKKKLMSEFKTKSFGKSDKQIMKMQETLIKKLSALHDKSLSDRKKIRADYVKRVGGRKNAISLKNLRQLTNAKPSTEKPTITKGFKLPHSEVVQIGGSRGEKRVDYLLFNSKPWDLQVLRWIVEDQVHNIIFHTKAPRKMYLTLEASGLDNTGKPNKAYFNTKAQFGKDEQLLNEQFSENLYKLDNPFLADKFLIANSMEDKPDLGSEENYLFSKIENIKVVFKVYY